MSHELHFWTARFAPEVEAMTDGVVAAMNAGLLRQLVPKTEVKFDRLASTLALLDRDDVDPGTRLEISEAALELAGQKRGRYGVGIVDLRRERRTPSRDADADYRLVYEIVENARRQKI